MRQSTSSLYVLSIALLPALTPSALAQSAGAQPPTSARVVRPVLAFPDARLDDSAAYPGYQTRLFRDAAGNTVQLYLDQRKGRVVNLWADGENASAAMSARDGSGAPAALRWADGGATVARTGRTRTVAYALAAASPALRLGQFLLGSMRFERDFQYQERQKAPYDSVWTLPEYAGLLGALERLPADEQRRHLALLDAAGVGELRARLRPTLAVTSTAAAWRAQFVQPSLDARDTLTLAVEVDPRRVEAAATADSVTLRARGGGVVPFTLRVTTNGRTLTPLARAEIFTPGFLRFLASAEARARAGTDADRVRALRLERQARGVELLASREKLQAGLPTYATYFGRDDLMAALMMRGTVWRDAVVESVIGGVLRTQGPTGEISHEEALGGQAIRESAAEYALVLAARDSAAGRGDRRAADSLLARARDVLRDARVTRQNRIMVDDEYQLAVLAGRYLADPAVSAARRRAFLLDRADGGVPRLTRLLRELAFVARKTAPYVDAPTATNLVAFPPSPDGGWVQASWRDSRVGFGGGKYGMDVNAIWVPHALESTGRVLAALRAMGFSTDSLARALPDALGAATPLGRYARDGAALDRAVAAWRGAGRHFVVRLAPAEVRERVAARLNAMPAEERAYWSGVLARTGADRDSLVFEAVGLDAGGAPIPIANTDPSTRLFLGDREPGDADEGRVPADTAADQARARRDAALVTRPYPAGLLVDGVGVAVSNDAYAGPAVWQAFARDPYHGPKVVWGREVNLFVLGTLGRAARGGADAAALRAAARRAYGAAEASGFHSELWSYEVRGGRAAAVRYGDASDVQLWTTTDLAVALALAGAER